MYILLNIIEQTLRACSFPRNLHIYTPLSTADLLPNMCPFQGGTTSRGFSEVLKIEPYSDFVGRNEEVEKLTGWISLHRSESVALSVYGASGIGKSTLASNVYNSTEVLRMFQRRAWVAMVHPFNKEEFLRDTISQFKAYHRVRESKSGIKNKSCDDLVIEICQLMEDRRSLLVVDGLSAEEEWDQVKSCLWTEFGANSGSCTVIVTTTSAAVARHCSGDSNLMYELSPLNSAAAHRLFYQKVCI